MSVLRSAHRPGSVSARWLAAVSLAALGSGLPLSAHAQSSTWDATISNTSWYVPVPVMLAYGAPSSSFANPIPMGDQTLWHLGTSTNGVFAGISTAQFAVGPILTLSASTIQGVVTPAGQITMIFTPVDGGTATIGLGQMQTKGGVTEMEMQMITGTSLLVTHWAYMTPYNPATFTPPTATTIPVSIAAPQWSWTAGTPWRIVSPTTFGTTAPGKFIITDYKNGYFWGQGVTPGGTGTFTLLGSITPEGKVLFNSITAGTLSSLYGDITGDANGAQMAMDLYSLEGAAGIPTFTTLIPPYVNTVLATHTPAAIGAAQTLYAVAGTPPGLTGAMSPAIDVLNRLSGPALSAAISQTLPVLNAAATQATWNAQQGFEETIRGRLDLLSYAGTGAAPPAAWLKPFGSLASQGSRNGVSGYDSSGGGVTAGFDREVAPGLTLGAAGAYGYSSVSLNGDAVANGLTLNSYYLALYASYALTPHTLVSMQLDGAYNRNAEHRTVDIVGATASADYTSTGGHVGLGIKEIFTLSPTLQIAPALRLDYARVAADGYGESGAGALSLTVGSQSYETLSLTAELGGAYGLSAHVKLLAKAGIGYNMLNSQNQITASYAGGGAAFVTYGASLSPWLASGGLSLVGFQQDALELGLSYDVEASPSGYFNQMGSLFLKVRM